METKRNFAPAKPTVLSAWDVGLPGKTHCPAFSAACAGTSGSSLPHPRFWVCRRAYLSWNHLGYKRVLSLRIFDATPCSFHYFFYITEVLLTVSSKQFTKSMDASPTSTA